MEKRNSVILFAVIVIAIVGIVVFSVGNGESQTPTRVQLNSTSNSSSSGEQSLPGVTSQSVTMTELSSHNQKNDCWVGYEGKAYDLTAWLPKHPGSSAAIEPYCGTASEFEAAFKGQHGTSQVKRLMKESVYKGDLA